MDITFITNWLKSTVIGIIILGALGSILAVFIFQLFNFLSKKLIPKWRQALINRFHKYGYKHGYTLGYLICSKNTSGVIVYLSLHISLMFIYLICWIFFFNLFILLINLTTPILSISSYVSIFLSFIFLFRAANEYHHINFAYNQVIDPIINVALNKYQEKNNDSLIKSTKSKK